MGMRFFFELKELPDFTLTKYQAVNISDLNSVVRNNAVFLKQRGKCTVLRRTAG